MAQIVCIIGNKGGTGKTTVSHMLAQGLGLLGQRSACVLTDPDREPLDPAGRRYLIADARSREALAKVIDKIRELPGWMGVIDGGANRSQADRELYAIADLVLLPFRDSHEDMRTVVRDLRTFRRAWALPCQWPTNPWQRQAAERTTGQMLAGFEERVLEPVAALSASKLLLQRRLPETVPTSLANACRRIAGQTLDLLRMRCEPPLEEPAAAEQVDAADAVGMMPGAPARPAYASLTHH
jgi:chromosome partitioning protein